MNTTERTRRLVKGCATPCFEVVESQSHIYGRATLTWFEEIFEESYPSI